MRKLTLIAAAVPVGLIVGLTAWFVAGGGSSAAAALAPLSAAMERPIAPRRSPPRAMDRSSAALVGAPLFALTAGPGAIREPSIRVDGLSVSTRRTAALLSIDGRPSEWLRVGESRYGVSIQAVTGSVVVLETAVSTKELALGEQAAATAPAPEQMAAGPAQDLPAGVRAPLEPASAPR